MARTRDYKMVLDAETCPIDSNKIGVDPNNMLVYDIGYTICDRYGNVYETRSFVIDEIFLGEFARMKSSYYASKIPQYIRDLIAGTRVLATWSEVREIIRADLKKWNIKRFYAYNSRFDYYSIISTNNFLGCEEKFLPSDLTICDIMKMADVIVSTPDYVDFCVTNEFMTPRNAPRKTAEVLYKYISKNLDFVESHTGLEDVFIEKEIMRCCYAKHKRMEERLFVKKS